MTDDYNPPVRLLFLFALLGACVGTPEPEREVLVRAAAEGDALRVWFRYPYPNDTERRARLRADGGRLAQVTHSPDLRTVSALWLERSGELVCRFPRGAEARLGAGETGDTAVVEYVFLAQADARVSAEVARACTMTPRLILRIFVAPDDLPARLVLPDGGEVALTDPVSIHVLELERSPAGVLREGDVMLRLRTAAGTHPFLVGVDPDGTPTATSGYVQKWRDEPELGEPWD
jgi:hypothetical protein